MSGGFPGTGTGKPLDPNSDLSAAEQGIKPRIAAPSGINKIAI
jgi:hypothetical protein